MCCGAVSEEPGLVAVILWSVSKWTLKGSTRSRKNLVALWRISRLTLSSYWIQIFKEPIHTSDGKDQDNSGKNALLYLRDHWNDVA